MPLRGMTPRQLVQDQYERVHLNLYVKPGQPVTSYLTALTGCATLLNVLHSFPADWAISLPSFRRLLWLPNIFRD